MLHIAASRHDTGRYQLGLHHWRSGALFIRIAVRGRWSEKHRGRKIKRVYRPLHQQALEGNPCG